MLAALLLAALFLGVVQRELALVAPNYDEGVYVMQARQALDGLTPYADFFYHQTPLYLHSLAGFFAIAGDSLWHARLLSLMATAASGVIVAVIARQWLPAAPALAAQIIFYSAPLQRYGTMALPNALMLLASLAGICVLVRSGTAAAAAAAGVLLALAVLLKPLDLPVVLAVGGWLALRREERGRLPVFVAAGIATAIVAAVAIHLTSHGAFTQTLEVQASRYSERKGFFVLAQHVPDFRQAIAERGVTTALGWNISEHVQAFTSFGPVNGNLWLLIAGVCGLIFARAHLPSGAVALASSWAAMPLAFSLLVWEPSWDHYFVQYVPPLAVAAAALFAAALARGGRRASAAVFVLTLYAALGFVSRPSDPDFYARAQELGARLSKPYLTFSPLISLAGGTEPACGMTDPQNIFGEYSAPMSVPEGPLMRFLITPQKLIDCIGTDMPVVIDRFAFWFLEPALYRHLAATPHRLSYFTPEDEKRFAAGPEAGFVAPVEPASAAQ